MTQREIAKVCHQANKAYCETLGDDSQLNFNKAPNWQVDSAINGVRFAQDNPDSTPEDSHKNWLKEKEADGWVYGEEKDTKKKTHPCIMAYGALPKDQRVKDSLFQAIVKALS